MATARLIYQFDAFSEPDFLARSGYIVSSMTDNPAFPEPYPAPVPSVARLRQDFDTYRDAYHAALQRDTGKIALRNEARRILTRGLQALAVYLDLVADGDDTRLGTTGFELRRTTPRAPAGGSVSGPLGRPDNFRVGQGPRAGMLQIDAGNVRGAMGYEIQICQGDPMDDSRWKSAVTVRSVRQTLLADLPTGPTWVRLRAVAPNGSCGPWTLPISVVVG